MSLADNLKKQFDWLRDYFHDLYGASFGPSKYDDMPPGPEVTVDIEFGRMNVGHNPPRFAADEVEFYKVLLRRMMDELADREMEFLTHAVCMCDSPIERIFIASFWFTCIATYVSMDEGRPAVLINGEHASGKPFGPNSITIEPQAKVGNYRTDFRITRIELAPDFDHKDENGAPGVKTSRREIVVECDGHDFHERTKEQAARDKSRDRELQAVGYRVFHFTGSEIWNRPIQCAKEVIDALNDSAKD